MQRPWFAFGIIVSILCWSAGPAIRASPGHPPTPLEISVTVPSDPGDLAPVKDWLGSDPLKVKIYVVVRIKNISNQPVVLVDFSHGEPAMNFSSSSPDTRPSKVFISLNGQLDWVLLKPGETIYAVDNIAREIAFLKAGTYKVDYQLYVRYSYYKGTSGSETEESLSKAYPKADNENSAVGGLEVPITVNQVSPR